MLTLLPPFATRRLRPARLAALLLAALLALFGLAAARPAAAQTTYVVTTPPDDSTGGFPFPAGCHQQRQRQRGGSTITFEPGRVHARHAPHHHAHEPAARAGRQRDHHRPRRVRRGRGRAERGPALLRQLRRDRDPVRPDHPERQAARQRPAGGGVYNAGTLTLTGCTLTGNSAPAYGGGGGVCNNGGTLTLTGCTLTGTAAPTAAAAASTTRRHADADRLHPHRKQRPNDYGGGVFNTRRHADADRLHPHRQQRHQHGGGVLNDMRHG